jgi:hypothetical protein
MAYKSRVDAIGLQKEREKQEAEMRVKRAAEMAAKAEEEKRAKVWEKFDSFCEAARDGIKHSSLKATGDAITGAKSELDAIENEGLEGIERGETIIQFLRAELDRKKKAPAGKQSRWNSVINKYEAVVDRADCEDQEGVLLNAYAAFRICELRIHLQKTYIGQYRNSRLSTGMRNSANKKADDEAREGKVYLGLLRSKRFSSAKDENGRNLLSRANGL